MMFSRRTFVQSFAGLLALSAAGMQSISAEEHEEDGFGMSLSM